jgi:multidrug efflux pump subunit AcrB
VLRQPLEERNAITDLGNAYLPTASGRSMPLTQIAKVSFDWEPGVMWREGRHYAVTVQGDVVEGVQGPTVTAQVWPAAARTGRAHAHRLWHPDCRARWKKAARARAPSLPACR